MSQASSLRRLLMTSRLRTGSRASNPSLSNQSTSRYTLARGRSSLSIRSPTAGGAGAAAIASSRAKERSRMPVFRLRASTAFGEAAGGGPKVGWLSIFPSLKTLLLKRRSMEPRRLVKTCRVPARCAARRETCHGALPFFALPHAPGAGRRCAGAVARGAGDDKVFGQQLSSLLPLWLRKAGPLRNRDLRAGVTALRHSGILRITLQARWP